ncbi:MAG: hypothetical protein A2827_03450 [Candidatus Spechtbacteria bacterium RIFCSPHIGHO2_01_FULL_43_30]|uniref:Uncharacterized protein n=1 Tax=Candidatus Spechtbacteria bacterium RIFCSPHIGHO2_01_FULL_43_30 TaxID=1802158 RepID=A0A1G2H8K8_9BACT|nr:MAG: hypothetical protein A2827_03450 [Candidatus Spechtbacteria bacterium RIFCSPHIGHO2_01_FULL_43_30]
MVKIEKIYIGGWFQRTTLHLSEIYDFLKQADSPLKLDKAKLSELRNEMRISSVEMKLGNLDCVIVKSDLGIEVKIYEDGLIVLCKVNGLSIKNEIQTLATYYEQKLSPGIRYIFSLGAPIPKDLANIKTIFPYFIILDNSPKQDIKELFGQFKQEKYFEILKKEFEIYRGDKLYVINNFSEKLSNIEDFVEEQVFIREFKSQLHRYLNLHRIIWERIADVKERGKIKGSEVGLFKDKIESYSKTINLIDGRISQMGTYIRTRESIAKNNAGLANFLDVLDFKYETLADTLEYIKDIWNMTKNYVNSALDLFSSIQAASTESSVTNLTVITSMGVGATLIGLFSEKLPEFHISGVMYFLIVASIGYIANKIMKMIYTRRMYKISDVKIVKDIK